MTAGLAPREANQTRAGRNESQAIERGEEMALKLLQGYCAGIAFLALVGCGSAPEADEVVTGEIMQEMPDASAMSMDGSAGICCAASRARPPASLS